MDGRENTTLGILCTISVKKQETYIFAYTA